MHHKATITTRFVGTSKPNHVECSCGPAGDFATEEMCLGWTVSHLSKIGPTETSEVVFAKVGLAIKAPTLKAKAASTFTPTPKAKK